MHCELSSLIWALSLTNQRKSRKHFILLSPYILVSPPSLMPLAMLAKVIQPLNQKHCTVPVPGESPSKENPPRWRLSFSSEVSINYSEYRIKPSLLCRRHFSCFLNRMTLFPMRKALLKKVKCLL